MISAKRLTSLMTCLLATFSTYSANAQEQHLYPTIAFLKREIDSNHPGFGVGYVVGVLHTLRHASELSMRNGGKPVACLTSNVMLSPRELADAMVRDFNDSPKWGPDTELHPHLIQIEVVNILTERGQCN